MFVAWIPDGCKVSLGLECSKFLFRSSFPPYGTSLEMSIIHHTLACTQTKIKEKMKYAGTKEAIKAACGGLSTHINATDMDEITADIINKECNKI